MATLRGVGKEGGAGRRHKLRIVVVDDDRDAATTLASILKDEGDDVHTVLRGDEALDLCRLVRPDVVIADINMPGMSGYALAREIRQHFGPLSPTLIGVSGVFTSTSDKLLGQAVGFDFYLLKPCDPAFILHLLEQVRSGTAVSGAAGGESTK
jgi:DNA-binding response OmpR family regulator